MDPVTIALGLAQFAPSILRFFGVGEKPVAVAEKVVSIAQQVTGAGTPEEALKRMQEDAAAQREFQMKVLEQDAELEKAYLADVQNARQREIAIATAESAPLINKIIAPLLALVVVIGGGCIMVWSPDADVRLGANSIMMLVLGYYFGTSMGSTKANQMMRDIARKGASES